MRLPFRYRCSYVRMLIFITAGTIGLLMKRALYFAPLATFDQPASDLDPNLSNLPLWELGKEPAQGSGSLESSGDENPTVPDVYTTPFEPTTRNYPTASPKRQSLLIYGADRSGTTFISRMFSADPQVMMVYEPLWVTKKWRKDDKLTDWRGSELGVVDAILSCDFAKTEWGRKFLEHTNRNWAAAKFDNPFTSDRFCNFTIDGKKTCFNLTAMPHVAQELCLTKYKHSVTKVAQVRVEDKHLATLVPQVFIDNPDTDVRVLQIIRDPRGFFNSRIKMKWIPDWNGGGLFLSEVRYACQKVADNIKYGRQVESLMPGRYMEVRYKDISLKPVETAKKIYEFAGFEMPASLIDWIIANTSPSKEELEKYKGRVFGSVRNSSANVDKWRSESPVERIEVIERECKQVFNFMPDLEMITLQEVLDENLN